MFKRKKVFQYLQMHRVTVTKDDSLSQNIKVELESVQDDLSGTRKDKFMLQAKVGELRNSMKTVFLQNQQLKQDLKQSRLRKVRHHVFHCEHLSAFHKISSHSIFWNVVYTTKSSFVIAYE